MLRGAARLGAPGAVVVANPLPEDEQLDPELHDRVLREGLAAAADAGRRAASDVTPFLLERFHARHGRREPAGERPARAAQRRAGRGDRGGVTSRIVVLGDVMVDVVAVHDGPLATGSDTPARIVLRPGGSGGERRRVARRAPARGDADRARRRRRRAPTSRWRGLTASTLRVTRDAERADRHVHRARRARRRAHDAPRPGRQRRARAATCPTSCSTAARCTSPATRCCAPGSRARRWRRSSGRATPG